MLITKYAKKKRVHMKPDIAKSQITVMRIPRIRILQMKWKLINHLARFTLTIIRIVAEIIRYMKLSSLCNRNSLSYFHHYLFNHRPCVSISLVTVMGTIIVFNAGVLLDSEYKVQRDSNYSLVLKTSI
jgi:hypothetical protein